MLDHAAFRSASPPPKRVLDIEVAEAKQAGCQIDLVIFGVTKSEPDETVDTTGLGAVPHGLKCLDVIAIENTVNGDAVGEFRVWLTIPIETKSSDHVPMVSAQVAIWP